MRIEWIFSHDDIARVKDFIAKYDSRPFVTARIDCNLSPEKSPVQQSVFWERLIGCLLTSQQKSGANSAVQRFIDLSPFPLALHACKSQPNIEHFSFDILKKFGGLRRTTIISEQIAANFEFLSDDGWDSTFKRLESVRTSQTPEVERAAAAFLAKHLKGIGPKQSRNLLQWLGFSRFEVPIDSRSARWLNSNGFPIHVSVKALSDDSYYNLVSTGFQKLALSCGIFPCILDAIIFSSYEAS